MVCGYLTDVEGNYEYFERYVNISKVLRWTDDSARTKIDLEDGCEFVFGGDSQDKGIGDIRFVKHLLDLQKRYPTRVHFIIGNRDANKLRIRGELSEEALADENLKDDRSFPYWVEESKRVTPADFLRANDESNGGSEDNAANRLRWMLKDTMGADGAFERRRTELKLIEGREDISDADVVESYRKEVDPALGEDAFMLEYLTRAKLAHIYGRTLFVHGAIDEKNLGAVPGKPEAKHLVQWAEELNAFAAQEVAAFTSQSTTADGNATSRPGHRLMDYGVPNGNNGQTVVYNSFLSKGNAAPLPVKVGRFLKEASICNVVSGHSPHGDCPTVIRSHGVRVVMADTSYSEMGHQSSWGVDNRGIAVSEVLVHLDGKIQVHGQLASGAEIDYSLGGYYEASKTAAHEGAHEGCDEFVGREVGDGRWVKAKLQEGAGGEEEYLLCRGEGFKLHTEWVSRAWLEKQKLSKDDLAVWERIRYAVRGMLEIRSSIDRIKQRLNDWQASFHATVQETRERVLTNSPLKA